MSENRSKLGRAPQRIVIVLLPQNSIIRLLVVMATVSLTRIVGKVARYEPLNSVGWYYCWWIYFYSMYHNSLFVCFLFVCLVLFLSLFVSEGATWCSSGLRNRAFEFAGVAEMLRRFSVLIPTITPVILTDVFPCCDNTSVKSRSFPYRFFIIHHSCHPTVPRRKAWAESAPERRRVA
jgi:hypothetical protein